MNLHLRLLWVFLFSSLGDRIGVLDESRKRFRAWPHDCDLNLHLTNSRYLAFCDLARFHYTGQLRILFKLLRRNWLPVAQAQEISYLRPILPFQSFDIVTRFTHWDEKYWYADHKFFVADRLCATAQVRGVILHGTKLVPMSDVVTLAGQKVISPAKPAIVERWQDLMDAKKTSSSSSERTTRGGAK